MLRFALILFSGSLAAATLSNGQLTAEFDERGLTAIAGHRFTADNFSIDLDGHPYDSATLPRPAHTTTPDRLTFTYMAASYKFEVVYELRPGWRFLSKQVIVTAGASSRFRIDEVQVFRSAIAETMRDVYVINRSRKNLGTLNYGAAFRFDDAHGLLAVVQNPFLSFSLLGGSFSLTYRPEMPWDMSWGPFESDRGLLAPYRPSGVRLPEQMTPEWHLTAGDTSPGMDEAEVETFTDLVRAFLLYKPAKPLNVMVGWCANDYQIDIAAPQGRAEYKRILDTAAALGANHVLFAPANSEVSRREDSTDDWGWEYVLWLGMGEKIRRGEWDPSTGPLPASVQEMLNYARSKKLGLLAYVYPVLGFGGKRRRSNLGEHAFQDWLIHALEGFYKHTGITGYSFDHTFLNFDGASKYAQWWGWRRVMETLRRDIPDIVIDGRQAYQHYGPWTWLAGSYPHPTSTDEQPESFNAFPDLKLDRVSADRERYTAYWYRNYEFAPSEIVPGFITHQTPRNDDTGHMPAGPFRRRDWDYLGWRYSLLSSIAAGGWNNVINMIPARDPEEFRNFSDADKQWFRHWIDWANENKEYLRNARPLFGEPGIGKIDGVEALINGSGFVFLFNPNGRRLSATVNPHGMLLREIYPLERRLIGYMRVTLDGGAAVVLRLDPPPKSIDQPILFNAPGSAVVDGSVLRITGVRGECGTSENLMVAPPRGTHVDSVRVNDKNVPFSPAGEEGVKIPVTFAGALFRHYQQIDPAGPLRIPKRIFDQLAARRQAWPIPWTSEDYRSTWLAPQRLLLYLQFAEPDDRWDVRLKIDGRPVDLLKAYASVRAVRRDFVGFYADISLLSPDRDYKLELQLPAEIKPSRFQGLFVENVETEYTSEIK